MHWYIRRMSDWLQFYISLEPWLFHLTLRKHISGQSEIHALLTSNAKCGFIFWYGSGAWTCQPYTAVALQTISRHFRCPKDAINDQINVIRKKLGEEECTSGKEGKLTHLRYIDKQLRHQWAFQQYGMIPQNAWRQQRGLPENSVTILRVWSFNISFTRKLLPLLPFIHNPFAFH
jgi:hypothetical protein